MQDQEYKDMFKIEALELLSDLEAKLLEMKEGYDDIEQINSTFRILHTIKGTGSMFGFNDISDFAHNLETAFDFVRNKKVNITNDLINLTLTASDHMKTMLDAGDENKADNDFISEEILTALNELVPLIEDSPEKHDTKTAGILKSVSEDASSSDMTYRIRFRPSVDIFTTGTNPLLLLKELRGFGECDIIAHIDRIPLLNEYDHKACYTDWDIILTTKKSLDEVRDIFIFVEDSSEVDIDIIDDGTILDKEPKRDKLGEILLDRGDITAENLVPILQKQDEKQKKIGELLVEQDVVSKSKISSALSEQKHIQKVRKKKSGSVLASSVRVPAEKLDKLVNLVGEMVTVQERLSQLAVYEDIPELTSIAENIENLTDGLRDNTMSIRMVQFGITFTGFKRLVHDLSKDLEKNIVLITDGVETELDKTVIEKLNEPLVHILRNSIDHGIESKETRESAGKSSQGTILLSAEHSGAYVLISVSDDGAGLDPDVIYKKAIEKEIIAPGTEMTPKEILQLIFSPGFSTAKKVTDVSGRGVGMDVVKKSVEALRGSVEIDSDKGKGTTVTLKLPLTLAIIEGFLVEMEGDKFILPLSSVEECVELSQENVDRAQGWDFLNVRGELVPYIRLRKSFDIQSDPPEMEHVVITGVDGQRIGVVVDRVIGSHQTVIKPLGRAMKHSEDVSGATILGDGTVALILNLDKLVKAA